MLLVWIYLLGQIYPAHLSQTCILIGTAMLEPSLFALFARMTCYDCISWAVPENYVEMGREES